MPDLVSKARMFAQTPLDDPRLRAFLFGEILDEIEIANDTGRTYNSHLAWKVGMLFLATSDDLNLTQEQIDRIEKVLSPQTAEQKAIFYAGLFNRLNVYDLSPIQRNAEEFYIPLALARLKRDASQISLQDRHSIDIHLLRWTHMEDPHATVSPMHALAITSYVLDNLLAYEKNGLDAKYLYGYRTGHALEIALNLYSLRKNPFALTPNLYDPNEQAEFEMYNLARLKRTPFDQEKIDAFIEKTITTGCALAEEGFHTSPKNGFAYLSDLLEYAGIKAPGQGLEGFSTGFLQKLPEYGFRISKSEKLIGMIQTCLDAHRNDVPTFTSPLDRPSANILQQVKLSVVKNVHFKGPSGPRARLYLVNNATEKKL